MRRLTILGFALAMLHLRDGGVQANPIQLLSIEGGAGTNVTVGTTNVGSISLPEYMPITLNYSSQGGIVNEQVGSITYQPPAGWVPGVEQSNPVTAQFYVNLAALAPGSTDTYQGPQLDISGVATGTLVGPGAGGEYRRWSGGYSGTATAASLWPMGSQDVSQLPAPLLDILNHPDHFHCQRALKTSHRWALENQPL